MANIRFNFKKNNDSYFHIMESIEINDGATLKTIFPALTVVVTNKNDTDFTVTTSTETLNFTKVSNVILVDDINLNSQPASVIATILQELFWYGTSKAKILDLYPKGWLRLLPTKTQTEINLDPSNAPFTIPTRGNG